MKSQEFSKYERARIIGARGLQISMDAPLLVDLEASTLDEINYDPLKIAERELNEGVLPITVSKPMPTKRDEDIEKLKVEESKMSDEAKEKAEQEEEKEIAERGEIIELANPDDDDIEEDLSAESNGSEELE